MSLLAINILTSSNYEDLEEKDKIATICVIR